MSFAGEFALEDELELELEDEFEVSSQPPTRPRPGDPDVALVQRMAARPVPGMPGVTLQQLIEKWRPAIAPEIPMTVLLGFIRFESGGNFSDATHGYRSKTPPHVHIPQPPYYELGLFQTPAGRYGKCARDGSHCEFAPPGLEVPSDPSQWFLLCKNIRANPQDWTNPTTQVRVGLYDLKTSAVRIRKAYPSLFPTLGTDWYLRMAVLMPFARGGGFTRAFLTGFRSDLEKLPENQRWNFLRAKKVTTHRVRWVFDPGNVDKKMALATKLG